MKERATTPRKRAKTDTARARYVELKRIPEERRREILAQVQEKMRDVRSEGGIGEGQGVLDAAESSEADIQDDIEFALIQMKSETLNRIEEALTRLDDGTFGDCFECGAQLSGRETELSSLETTLDFSPQPVCQFQQAAAGEELSGVGGVYVDADAHCASSTN